MPDNIVFYFVFLSQIVLLSYYYPRRILSKVKQMLTSYPPTDYPKLYPKPIEYYKIGQWVYQLANRIILGLGLIIIFAVGYWDISSEGKVSEMLPFVYWAVQVTPILLMELLGYANFRLMRKADLRTSRHAGLQPRHLSDFIAIPVVVLAFILYVSSILFFNSINPFQVSLSNDTFIIFLSQTASNLIFAVIIFRNLYGKKINPHQTNKDRTRQIEVIVRSLVYMSIGASLFLMVFQGVDNFELDHLEPSLMSMYLQFVVFIGLGALLRKLRVEDMDFSVYKADLSVTDPAN